jgi:hypothetical protein
MVIPGVMVFFFTQKSRHRLCLHSRAKTLIKDGFHAARTGNSAQPGQTNVEISTGLTINCQKL